jgi:hypothetical protein
MLLCSYAHEERLPAYRHYAPLRWPCLMVIIESRGDGILAREPPVSRGHSS